MPKHRPAFGEIELRDFMPADISMLMDLSTDPYLPLIGTLPADTDADGARAYVERQQDRLRSGTGYSFCAARRDRFVDGEAGEAVGQAGLWLTAVPDGRATAGYCIAPRFRGHGFARQALTALTAFGWTLPELHRIELYIEPWNVASARTAETAGYQFEGRLRSHQQIGEHRVDMDLYAAVRRTAGPGLNRS